MEPRIRRGPGCERWRELARDAEEPWLASFGTVGDDGTIVKVTIDPIASSFTVWCHHPTGAASRHELESLRAVEIGEGILAECDRGPGPTMRLTVRSGPRTQMRLELHSGEARPEVSSWS